LLTNLVINFKIGAVFVFFVVVFSLVYNLMWYLPSVVLSTYRAAPSVRIISGPRLSLVVNPCALVLFICRLIFILNTF
jgi:predicted membrane protein